MPDEQIKRVAGYAWFMNNPPPTPEQLYRFMMRYLSESGRKKFEFIKLVTDYGRPKSLSKRIGWNQVFWIDPLFQMLPLRVGTLLSFR